MYSMCVTISSNIFIKFLNSKERIKNKSWAKADFRLSKPE